MVSNTRKSSQAIEAAMIEVMKIPGPGLYNHLIRFRGNARVINMLA
jgi:hypothetical protein